MRHDKKAIIKFYRDIFADKTESTGCRFLIKHAIQYHPGYRSEKGDIVTLGYSSHLSEAKMMTTLQRSLMITEIGCVYLQQKDYSKVENIGHPLGFCRIVKVWLTFPLGEQSWEQKHLLFDHLLDYIKHLGLIDSTVEEWVEHYDVYKILFKIMRSIQKEYKILYSYGQGNIGQSVSVAVTR